MKKIDELLSRFYGRPVTGGFNNAGWHCVFSTVGGTELVAGGVGEKLAPQVAELLDAMAALEAAAAEFEKGLER